MTPREEYQDLVNHQLPQAAQSGTYPVRFNHCFARIILDNICGQTWYSVIDRPAYKNMTDQQLKDAVALGQSFLANPQRCHRANQKSLQYRHRHPV
ncbi:MAG: hypothetical protein AAF651_01030 [Cyanobacteria bacterium P01_C01_bin.73]